MGIKSTLRASSLAILWILGFSFTGTTPADAAAPTPQFSLTAIASKISGNNWTNDGSVGGTATLSTWGSITPNFVAADTAVAINETASTGQYITGSAGAISGGVITVELTMKIPSTQANSPGNYGMVFGWNGSYYDIWMQNNNSIGFNTGAGDVYGIPTASYLNSYHTFTFVMSTADKSDTGTQRIYVDGVKQNTPYSYWAGTASNATNKTFDTTNGTFDIGRYGSNSDFPGTFRLRSFKLWLSNIGDAAVADSYNSQFKPTTHTIALTSGLTSAVYRTTSTIQSTSDVDGKVTFYFNGKRIPGCINIQTVSKQASCTWKPAAVGINQITSQIVAPGGSLTSSTSRIIVASRSTKR